MIALLCDKDEQMLTSLLSRFDEVCVFEDGVALAYYLQKQNPCSLAVIAVEGAAGMNGCTYVKHNRESVSVLWITEQPDFFNQSRRIPVDGFLTKPVEAATIEKTVQILLQRRETIASHGKRRA